MYVTSCNEFDPSCDKAGLRSGQIPFLGSMQFLRRFTICDQNFQGAPRELHEIMPFSHPPPGASLFPEVEKGGYSSVTSVSREESLESSEDSAGVPPELDISRTYFLKRKTT